MRFFKFLSMFILISFLSTNSLEAQLLKKLKKRVQEATEDVIAEKAAQKAEQEVGKTLDSLLDIDPDYQANYQRQMSQFMLSGSEDIPIEESYTFQTRVTYEFTMTERDQTSTVNYEMWFPKNDGYMGTKVMDQPDSDPKDMPSSVVSIIDDKNQAMIILIEEQKIAQLLSMSKIQEIAEVEKETESEMTAFNSLQKTGKTKKILGYDCEEFYSQNETNKLTFWVTQDLELFQKNMFFNISKSLGGNTFENIPETAKGFMMEMRFENLSTVETGIMTVTDIKKSEKVITMADYQLMNLSRFMQK